MDKNTITGLVLIGILLVGFSYLSRPSEEQIAAQKKYYDSIAVVQQQQEALKAKTEAALANENKGAAAAADSSALFFNAMHGTDSKVSIQNSVAEITFTTKGGRVYSAMLKEYKGQDKTNPVVLFDGDDATMSFNFYNKQGAIQTKDYYFEAVNKTDSSVTMRLAADNASYIDFIYTLKPNSYLMNFEIKATGMEGKLASTEYVDIDWTQRARQLEKGFTYENRLSELTYKVKGDNVDNLSAAKDDEKDLGNTAIDWVAFKNQFFSSVFIADQDFNKVSVKSRMEQQGSGYIKDYSAEMSTFFDPSGKQPTEMYFYFGPNHFKTLKALDKGRTEKWELNRLVYLGWPLIRWINQFITINVFDWLSGWGLSMGIVLLILTIMVKVVVYPATWKTYMSSAKMRVLKPNRRDQQEVSEAGRCDEETAGGDEPLQPVWREPDGRLSANVIAVPDLDGIVHVRTERYRVTSAELLVGGRLVHLRRVHHIPVPYPVPGQPSQLVLLADDGNQHPEHKVYNDDAGYRSTTANGCDEMDDVSDADYVPVRTERLSFGIELLLFRVNTD